MSVRRLAANTEPIFGDPDGSQEGFANHTLRQVVRASRGGTAVRMRLSTSLTTPHRACDLQDLHPKA
jgi:hypothetical protein